MRDFMGPAIRGAFPYGAYVVMDIHRRSRHYHKFFSDGFSLCFSKQRPINPGRKDKDPGRQADDFMSHA